MHTRVKPNGEKKIIFYNSSIKYSKHYHIQVHQMIIHKLIQKALKEGDMPALSPKDAYALLLDRADAVLIDVRTQAEWDWVGYVDIPKSQLLHVEWLHYPGSEKNVNFLPSCIKYPKETPLLLLCRSGVRSKMAAKLLAEEGFKYAIDVLDGFEGPRDRQNHRKMVAGWCYDNLPWIGA